MQRLGLLGGTFDPIHNGHLQCALAVAKQMQLDQVALLPNALPPHKATPGVSPQQRLAMVELACAPYPQLSVDGRELARAGHSYTVDTLAEMRAEQPQRQLYFIMGMDSLLSFPQWHQPQQILALCHLLVCPRPGYTLPRHGAVCDLLARHQITCAAQLQQQPHGAIFLVDAPLLDVASSTLRQQLQQPKQSALTALPSPVAAYIREQRLYNAEADAPTKPFCSNSHIN